MSVDLCFARCIADNREMVPRKDYDDYSRYINDSYLSRKDLVREGIEKITTVQHSKI